MDGVIIAGIDIGTTKVSTVIGRVGDPERVEILGTGKEGLNSVKKGVIVDIENTAETIRKSVRQAEEMANVKVVSAYVNIAGLHVGIVGNRKEISVSSEDREITRRDVDKLLYSVRDVPVPQDMQLIDIVPRQYTVDSYDEILDPVGMVGVKLGVEADIIVGKITSVQNIVRSMERAGIKVSGIVVEALATGETALAPDERDLGVVLIDMGGGVTDVSFFRNKKLVFCGSIPVGGDHITNDISITLKIPYHEAEKIKREYRLALTSLITNDHEISVTDINDGRKKVVRISEIVEIIEARVQEIFALCKNLLESRGIAGGYMEGVVLTGAGIYFLSGGCEIARQVFGCSARLASFRSLDVPKIEYSTAAGIVRYAMNHYRNANAKSEVKLQSKGEEKKRFALFDYLVKLVKSLF